MISINSNFELLFESLPDKILNLFEKTKQDIKLDDLWFENASKEIDKILIDHNIFIHFDFHNHSNITGKTAFENEKILIIIFIPKDKTELTIQDYKDLTITFLHELSHALSYTKLETEIPIKRKGVPTGRKLSTLISNPFFYNIKNFTKEELIKTFDYIFNPREKSTYAFEIALSCYLDQEKKLNVQYVYNVSINIIKLYFAGKITNFEVDKWINRLSKDISKLFLLQYAVQLLKETKDPNYKKYYNQLISFVKLCNYYETRIEKILGEKS